MSRSSSAAGISIAKTRKSPASSSSTTACRAASGVFLYAASKASSSAATSVPLSMPFSRSISRIPSMISWLIALPLVDQVAPHDGVVRDVHFVSLGGEPERPLACRDDLAAEPAAAADVPVGAQRHTPPDGVAEVRRLA